MKGLDLREYATIRKMERDYGGRYNWKLLKAESERLGIPSTYEEDEELGDISSYHRAVWKRVYHLDVKKVRKITAYQCGYCDKYYKHDSSAKRHEKQCFHNPSTQSCATCCFYVDRSINEDFDGDAPICDLGIVFDYTEWGRIRLRTNCDKWKLRE